MSEAATVERSASVHGWWEVVVVLDMDRACCDNGASAHDSQAGDQTLGWFLQARKVWTLRLLWHPLLVGRDGVALLTHHGPLVKLGELHAVGAATELRWYGEDLNGPADPTVGHRPQNYARIAT